MKHDVSLVIASARAANAIIVRSCCLCFLPVVFTLCTRSSVLFQHLIMSRLTTHTLALTFVNVTPPGIYTNIVPHASVTPTVISNTDAWPLLETSTGAGSSATVYVGTILHLGCASCSLSVRYAVCEILTTRVAHYRL